MIFNEDQRRSMWDAAEIGKRMASCRFDNYTPRNDDQRSSFATCKKFADGLNSDKTGAGLILVGPPGTGKTHMAISIFRSAIESDMNALYTSVDAIISEARASDRFSSKITRKDVLRDLARYDLLIIDEVGLQSGNTDDVRFLHSVIDRRTQDGTSTVLVSNLPKDEIHTAIGERALDRMRQTSKLCVFSGDSYRSEYKQKINKGETPEFGKSKGMMPEWMNGVG